uniref:CUB domain-containing protein n=1 Tax=Macrostomum lignano TaxID=282301 RepID=A0A1I8FJK4_9PLAT
VLLLSLLHCWLASHGGTADLSLGRPDPQAWPARTPSAFSFRRTMASSVAAIVGELGDEAAGSGRRRGLERRQLLSDRRRPAHNKTGRTKRPATGSPIGDIVDTKLSTSSPIKKNRNYRPNARRRLQRSVRVVPFENNTDCGLPAICSAWRVGRCLHRVASQPDCLTQRCWDASGCVRLRRSGPRVSKAAMPAATAAWFKLEADPCRYGCCKLCFGLGSVDTTGIEQQLSSRTFEYSAGPALVKCVQAFSDAHVLLTIDPTRTGLSRHLLRIRTVANALLAGFSSRTRGALQRLRMATLRRFARPKSEATDRGQTDATLQSAQSCLFGNVGRVWRPRVLTIFGRAAAPSYLLVTSSLRRRALWTFDLKQAPSGISAKRLKRLLSLRPSLLKPGLFEMPQAYYRWTAQVWLPVWRFSDALSCPTAAYQSHSSDASAVRMRADSPERPTVGEAARTVVPGRRKSNRQRTAAANGGQCVTFRRDRSDLDVAAAARRSSPWPSQPSRLRPASSAVEIDSAIVNARALSIGLAELPSQDDDGLPPQARIPKSTGLTASASVDGGVRRDGPSIGRLLNVASAARPSLRRQAAKIDNSQHRRQRRRASSRGEDSRRRREQRRGRQSGSDGKPTGGGSPSFVLRCSLPTGNSTRPSRRSARSFGQPADPRRETQQLPSCDAVVEWLIENPESGTGDGVGAMEATLRLLSSGRLRSAQLMMMTTTNDDLDGKTTMRMTRTGSGADSSGASGSGSYKTIGDFPTIDEYASYVKSLVRVGSRALFGPATSSQVVSIDCDDLHDFEMCASPAPGGGGGGGGSEDRRSRLCGSKREKTPMENGFGRGEQHGHGGDDSTAGRQRRSLTRSAALESWRSGGQVRPEIANPRYRWGSVTQPALASWSPCAASPQAQPEAIVDFPEHHGWRCPTVGADRRPGRLSRRLLLRRLLDGADSRLSLRLPSLPGFQTCGEACYLGGQSGHQPGHEFHVIASPDASPVRAGSCATQRDATAASDVGGAAAATAAAAGADPVAGRRRRLRSNRKRRSHWGYCVKQVTVSSRGDLVRRMLGDSRAAGGGGCWRSAAKTSGARHWIRLEMNEEIVIDRLSIKLDLADSLYLPKLVIVSLGDLTKGFKEVARFNPTAANAASGRGSSMTEWLTLLQNCDRAHRMVEIVLMDSRDDTVFNA